MIPYAFLASMENTIETQQLINIETLDFLIGSFETIIIVVTNLLIAITGGYAIKFFNKLKEKNHNAVFGYYARLLVRLHGIKAIFDKYGEYVMERFLPEDKRKPVNPANHVSVDHAINELIIAAEDTLHFLMIEEDQMPASREWPIYYADLLSFLEDCVKIKTPTYFKWVEYNDEIKQYRDKHNHNLDVMINCILRRQITISQKLYKNEKS